MKIYACPRCGSTDIGMGSLSAGITYGVTSWKEECRNCGYRGHPLIFDDKQKYQDFIENIKNKKEESTEEKQTDPSNNLSQKDREVIASLKSFEQDDSCEKPCFNFSEKNWWPEIIIAIVFSIALSIYLFPNILFLLPDLMAMENLVFLIPYIVFTTLLNLIMMLAIMLAIEYIAFNIKHTLIKR